MENSTEYLSSCLNILPEFPYKSFTFTAILKSTQYRTAPN